MDAIFSGLTGSLESSFRFIGSNDLVVFARRSFDSLWSDVSWVLSALFQGLCSTVTREVFEDSVLVVVSQFGELSELLEQFLSPRSSLLGSLLGDGT